MRICIDPGHGGRDPGAIGLNGLFEKDVVLDIARKLSRPRPQSQYVFIFTRLDDVFRTLSERGTLGSRQNIFISLHCNAAINRDAHGVETFFFKGNEQGRVLAEHINNALVIGTGWRNRGVKVTSQFAVLRRTQNIPSILIEYNFISNPDIENLLRQDEVRDDLASFTINGINSYLRR